MMDWYKYKVLYYCEADDTEKVDEGLLRADSYEDAVKQLKSDYDFVGGVMLEQLGEECYTLTREQIGKALAREFFEL